MHAGRTTTTSPRAARRHPPTAHSPTLDRARSYPIPIRRYFAANKLGVRPTGAKPDGFTRAAQARRLPCRMAIRRYACHPSVSRRVRLQGGGIWCGRGGRVLLHVMVAHDTTQLIGK